MGSGSNVNVLLDSGASRNLVDYDFCKRNGIKCFKLASGFTLRLADGSTPPSGRIDYGAKIPIRIRDTLFTIDCLVTWLSSQHPVVLGMEFLNDNFPEHVASLRAIGSESATKPKDTPARPATAFAVGPPPDSSDEIVFACAASIDPTAAYSAATLGGGDKMTAILAAIESEEKRRKSHNEIIFLRYARTWISAREAQPDNAAPVTIPDCLKDFADVFNLDYTNAPPKPLHGVECVIELKPGEQPPPPATPYPLSPDQRAEEKRQIDKLLALGRIEPVPPGKGTTAAPGFFVKKQCLGCHQLHCTCGKRQYEQRWVLDFRRLNAKTPQDPYPLPSVPDLMALAPGHAQYVKFDIDSAFHLVPVPEKYRHLTAFVCSLGTFQWTVMPFGLKNAPATFQRMIDTVLAPCREFCRAFMDDGLIWADDLETAQQRTRQVFECLRAAGLRVKLRKCSFFVPSVPYLGHVISRDGIATDPAKLQGIVNYPEPRTKTDVRAFLGLTGYYREFFRVDNKGFSEIACPLSDLTKDDRPATWETLPPEAARAFRTIRDYFADPAHLAPFDPEAPVDLVTDASTQAWGGVIEQNKQPLAFLSGKFSASERNWPTTDRELYACLQAHRQFPHLLQGDVTWYTDHKALEALRTTLANSPRRVHWRETLDLFPFKVKYRKGSEMHVDGMTRHSTWPADTGSSDPVLDAWRFPSDLGNRQPSNPGSRQTSDLGDRQTSDFGSSSVLTSSLDSNAPYPSRFSETVQKFRDSYVGSKASKIAQSRESYGAQESWERKRRVGRIRNGIGWKELDDKD